MADVTISALTQGVPTGNNLLPYSTGTNTLGAPVSAMFQNTSKVGIGTTDPLCNLHLIYNDADQTNFLHGLVIRNIATPGIAHFSVNSSANNCGIRSYNSTHPTKPSYNEIGNWSSEGQLSFMVRSQSRMNIDGSGRVTIPYQPAFHAWNQTAQALEGGAVMSFNATSSNVSRVFNQGGHYANNRFTAPVAGVYQFSANVLQNSTTGGRYWGIGLVLNGTDTIDFSYAAGTSQQGVNVSATIKLATNDYIDVRASTDGVINIDNSGAFSGHLVG